MNITELANWLEKRLQKPLPGLDAQMRMSSMRRVRELMANTNPLNVRDSSVLILFYPKGDSINFVVMRRPEYDGVHGGQISLPGGKRELDDITITHTALREAKEEIGVNPSMVKILGNLTPIYIPPSNFLVTPVVGWQPNKPEFTADPVEVAEIIEVLLADLMNDKHVQLKTIHLINGFVVDAPCYYIDGNIIWGATAMILSELKEILLDFDTETRGKA